MTNHSSLRIGRPSSRRPWVVLDVRTNRRAKPPRDVRNPNLNLARRDRNRRTERVPLVLLAFGFGALGFLLHAVRSDTERRLGPGHAVLDHGETKRDLYEKAKTEGIDGRSKMSKGELQDALHNGRE